MFLIDIHNALSCLKTDISGWFSALRLLQNASIKAAENLTFNAVDALMVITIMMMTMLIIMFSNNDVHICCSAKMQVCSFFHVYTFRNKVGTRFGKHSQKRYICILNRRFLLILV